MEGTLYLRTNCAPRCANLLTLVKPADSAPPSASKSSPSSYSVLSHGLVVAGLQIPTMNSKEAGATGAPSSPFRLSSLSLSQNSLLGALGHRLQCVVNARPQTRADSRVSVTSVDWHPSKDCRLTQPLPRWAKACGRSLYHLEPKRRWTTGWSIVLVGEGGSEAFHETSGGCNSRWYKGETRPAQFEDRVW